MISAIFALAFLFSFCVSQFTPTTPGPDELFKTGSDCDIEWDTDTSSPGWNNVTIALMSGSNDNMELVATVVTNLDGTNASLSPFIWQCPDVLPHAAIYFYQFTNGDDVVHSTWTARFTIASAFGEVAAPEHPSQPNGDPIPWGTGAVQGFTQKAASAEDPMSTEKEVISTRMRTAVSSTASLTRTQPFSSPTVISFPLSDAGASKYQSPLIYAGASSNAASLSLNLTRLVYTLVLITIVLAVFA